MKLQALRQVMEEIVYGRKKNAQIIFFNCKDRYLIKCNNFLDMALETILAEQFQITIFRQTH